MYFAACSCGVSGAGFDFGGPRGGPLLGFLFEAVAIFPPGGPRRFVDVGVCDGLGVVVV